MRSILLLIVFFGCTQFSFAQDSLMVKMDSSKTCANCYTKLVAVGGKYYVNSLNDTRNTLSANGFSLDQEAFEYQLRLFNLPKLFYYQQLGTLVNTNYASVTGFGLKEDIRFPLFKNSNFILTPYIEFGAGYYRMNIVKGVESNSVESVLDSEVENYFLDNFVFSGDIGLDLGFAFNVENKRFSVLFNGGYVTNYPTEWRLAGSLAFKEKITIGSPYAGVTFSMEMCDTNCCK
ncbi:MAG TPA: hypothetical protein VK169_19015 [Saprospiraceae bacterium]|nr:hypothetical protein [Saprospiraceae bacterium]